MQQLDPNKKKQLDTNIKLMLENGATEQDVISYAKDFNSKFVVKKKDGTNSVSTSTTPTENTASVQKVGSSATPKLTPEEKAEFDTAFKSKTVQQPKLNQPVQGATNFDTTATNEIKTPKPLQIGDKEKIILNQSRIASAIPKEKDIEFEQEFNAKLNNEGILNNLKTVAKKWWNNTFDDKGLQVSTDHLADEKKKATDELRREGIEKPTEKQLQERTKEIFVDEKKKNYKQSLINKYIESLPEEDRELVSLKLAKDLPTLDKDLVEKSNALILMEKDLKGIQKELSEMDRIASEQQKMGNQVGPEFEQEYNRLADSYNNKLTVAASMDKDMMESKAKLGSAMEEYDNFKRSYNDFDVLGNRLKTGTAKIGYGLASFKNYLDRADRALGTEIEGFTPEIKEIEENERKVSFANKVIDKEQEYFRKRLEEVNTAGDFVSYVTDVAGDQIPNMLPFMLTGGAGGGAVIFGSSTGNQYAEMVEGEINPTPFSRVYTNEEKFVAPLIFGTADTVLSAIPTYGRLLRGKRAIQASLANEAGQELFAKSAFQTAKKGLARIGKDNLGEQLEEQGANLIQNFTRVVYLKEQDASMLDGVEDVFKDTATFSTLLSAFPVAMGGVINAVTPKTDIASMDENSKQIIALKQRIAQGGLSTSQKEVIQSQIDKKVAQNKSIVMGIQKNMESKGEVVVAKVNEVNKEIDKKLTQAQEIKDGNLTKSQKEVLLQGLKEDYKTLSDRREFLLSDKSSAMDVLPIKEVDKLKREALAELTKELNPDGTKNIEIKDEQITERANKIYAKQIELKRVERAEKKLEEAQLQAKEQAEVVEVKQNIEKPSDEQQLLDIKNGDVVTFTYENKSEIPEIFKDKISSEGEINGKKEIKVTIAKSLAEYHLQNEATPANITPTNERVQLGANQMGEVAVEQQPTAEVVKTENLQFANEAGAVKGEVDLNLDDVSNFLNEQFGAKKPTEDKKEIVKKEPIAKKEEVEQAKGFVSMAVNKLTTSLKDFQGRTKEYSEQTYNRIVNEAKEGILNISAIPPIQVWKNPETGQFVILAGHSRTKAFSDLADGKVEFADKYKKSDFEKVNTQIVEAETLQEAQKIAQESNQGSVQTVVDNAKYVREKLLPTFQNFNQAKTKLRSLYGSAWARIYAYANLNPKGKAMQMLKQFQDANESDSDDKSKKIAEWTGKARQDFSNLTDAHENEIFDYLFKNDKIKTYAELSELLNRRVNGLEEFNINEPLNFEQKVGRGSNEVEALKEIQDLKNRDAQIKKKIKDLQSFGKNINETQRQQIKQLTAESIKINTVDIPNAQKKQKQARVADAEQFDIFSQINEQIENGNITPEQVDEFVNDDRKAEEIKPIVEVIESKAKSEKKVELEEVVAEVDAVLATEEEKVKETKKELSNKVRKLKIDLKKLSDGGLQSNPLGLPVAIWNASMDIIATSIDAGMEIAEAVKKAIDYIEKNYKGEFDKDLFVDVVSKKDSLSVKQINSIISKSKIEGKFLTKEEVSDLQKEIESNYVVTVSDLFQSNDIRQNVFNYDNPISERNVNGVNLRIAVGLIENIGTKNARNSYLLYADGKIAGKFYSVKDIKDVVKFIEMNLIRPSNLLESKTETKQQRKELLNAEVDKIAQKLKDLLPGIKDGDINAQGFSQDQLIDLVATAVKNLISAGIEIDEAIKQVVASIKDKFGIDVNVDDVKAKIEGPKKQQTESDEGFERKPGKKSLLNRAVSGGESSKITDAIAEYGLDYEIESQEKAQESAKSFVEKVGFDNALEVVRSNKIKGAEKAFVYAELIDILTSEIDSKIDGDERTALEEKHYQIMAEIMNEFDIESRDAGRFISALNRVYNSTNFKYNLSRQVKAYKARNNGKISAEKLQEYKEIDAKLKDLEQKIKEAEQRAMEAEAKLAMENIVEEVQRTYKKPTLQSNAKKAKDLANKIRRGKINKPDIFMSATPASLVWDGAIEIVAKSIEAGGSIADSVQKGIDYIKKSDWYKNLNDSDKKRAEKGLHDHIFENTKPAMVYIDEDGNIKVPESLIRSLVEQGVEDIDDLSEKVLDTIIDEYPELTLRQVRDAITKYGKTINPNPEKIASEIRKLRRMGKLISGLEDAKSGKRPLRSGLQRDELTQDERKMKRELRDLLRDLPLDDDSIERTWKTALDAIKSRLRNQIEDLEKQIANKEKSKPEKTPIEYDQEAKELKQVRDELKETLENIVGKPELTYEQRVTRSIASLERSISKLDDQISTKNIEYKTKPTPVTSAKIEELKEQKKKLTEEVNQMRIDSGVAEARRLQLAKSRLRNRIVELETRIKDKNYTIKKPVPVKADQELLNLQAEKIRTQERYDKDKYIDELNNRSRKEKIFDELLSIWNIARVVTATGELSWIMIQGGIQTISRTLSNPRQMFEIFKKMFKAMASESKAKEYESITKARENYTTMKQSKLALTEVDHKLEAKEEQFLGDLASALWDLFGKGLGKISNNKEFKSPYAFMMELLGKELRGSNKATLEQYWKNANPLRILERGNSVYMNELRVARFEDGMQILEADLKNPIDNLEEYKKLASAINTMTGRANIGMLQSNSKLLSVIFFSFRNAVSVINQLNPYFYLSLGNPKEPFKPSVAQKIAITDMMKFVTTTTGMLLLLQAALGYDDEDEPVATIETDPRSSDFGKLKIGNIRIDPWHGMMPAVTLISRIWTDENKNVNTGEISKGGTKFGSRTREQLMLDFATNKFNPSMGILWKYLSSHHEEVDGKEIRVDRYGKEYDVLGDVANLKPMYWEAISEIKKEQPGLWGDFFITTAALGINSQVYDKPKEKKNSYQRPRRPSIPRPPRP